ncbi:hypothetical protein BE08_40490 [Sorangium cellulosum]|uniref:Uncharacterized protein n=1 Tax=Sorangium cellulosum TaxID=56 RepID=A0A150P653_SORCE|nr:hypothetical protein BE08_40490 [Sorangium cellulosum]
MFERIQQYASYLSRAILAVPFVAIVGDYVVRGVLQIGLRREDEAPDLTGTVMACQSLLVLYTLGAMVLSRRFRQSREGRVLVATVVVTSAVRLHPSMPTGRSQYDAGRFLRNRVTAGDSAQLSVSEYQVADSLGLRGRPTMWLVSAQARTRNMFELETERYNALLHCTWQCHYTVYENETVALAFGNAHEASNVLTDGTVISIGDTIVDRINNEVARRYGAQIRAEFGREYMNFFGAVTTCVAKALLDRVRDLGVRLLRRVPVVNQLTFLDRLHEFITLDGRIISTRCDDICRVAYDNHTLARAREGDDYLGSLTPDEVYTNYVRPLLFLLDAYQIRPEDILPPNELRALAQQAGGQWPARLQ